MASITLTVDDAEVDRIARGLGWTPASPMTRAQFMKDWLIRRIKRAVTGTEKETARAAAIATAEAGVIDPVVT
jgi:hypothetical protein